jgi:glycosyltransferase involved in cell wall biosynthesis
MVTTFFGARSFGGDAAAIDRLSRALLRRGHEVHVVHCADSFDLLRGREPLREYTPPEGLRVHTLRSPLGPLSPLATQLSGRPWLKAAALREVLEAHDVDVVHFHNVSLVGGVGVLGMGGRAVRLMTAHEYWLFCPMHLLWKYDEAACDGPECTRCMLAAGKPPQLWRMGGAVDAHLQGLDALIFPSRHARLEHERRGVRAPMAVLPHFLPDEWSGGLEDEEPEPTERPYLAAAGRLVKMKGFQRVIPLMRYLPEVDLRIAGSGPYEPELRRLAEGLPNVKFAGLLGGGGLARLFHGARAVVVPSLFPETFGLVVLEAFAVRTPVIVHRGGGAIVEVGSESGGGLAYETDHELLLAMRRMVHDRALRDKLADRGYRRRVQEWSEAAHVDRYFALLNEARGRRAGHRPEGLAEPHAPTVRGAEVEGRRRAS